MYMMTIYDAIKRVINWPFISLSGLCSIVVFFYPDLSLKWKLVILGLFVLVVVFIILIIYIRELKKCISSLSNQTTERKDTRDCKINKEYLGTWIQYIPDFSRIIAVCDLKYYNGSYHFDGINFGEHGEKDVEFKSYKLIQDGPDQFFYITTAHYLSKPEEGEIHGFGKLYIRRRSSGVYKADGYFFDVESAYGETGQKAIQHFKMLKHDKMLYKQYKELNIPRDDNNIFQMGEKQIYEIIRDHTIIFADK